MEVVREINESFQQIEQAVLKEEPEIKEEPKSDGEDEVILPDISDITDVDPLQIDDIKQEEPEQISGNHKYSGYELWSQDRKVKLKAEFPDFNNSKILKLINKEWKALPDVVKEIWNKRAGPRRQSSRPRKPKEIKDIPESKRERKKSADPQSFKRQYITITLYPDNYDDQKRLEFEKMQEALMEAKKEKKKKAETRNMKHTTAYSLWSKDVRVILQKQSPLLTFSETSKRLGEMWKQLPDSEKYNFRRRAKRLNAKFREENPKITKQENEVGTITRVSSKGRVIAKSTKLSNFCAFEDKVKTRKSKMKPLPVTSEEVAKHAIDSGDQDPLTETRAKRKKRSTLSNEIFPDRGEVTSNSTVSKSDSSSFVDNKNENAKK